MPNADDSTHVLKDLNVYLTQGGVYYEAAVAKSDGDCRIPFVTRELVAQIRAGYVPTATSFNSQDPHTLEDIAQVNSGLSIPAEEQLVPEVEKPLEITQGEAEQHEDVVAAKTSGKEQETGVASSEAAGSIDSPATVTKELPVTERSEDGHTDPVTSADNSSLTTTQTSGLAALQEKHLGAGTGSSSGAETSELPTPVTTETPIEALPEKSVSTETEGAQTTI